MKNTSVPIDTLAYCAGLFDGEGCIYIKKRVQKAPSRKERSPYYALILKIKMVHKPTIEFLAQTFGVGTVTRESPGKLNKRVSWRWNVSARDSVYVLESLRPYLRLKSAEVDVALEFADANRRSAFGRNVVPKEVLEHRETLYQKMRALKNFHWE